MKGNPFASAITQPTREEAAPKEKKLVMSNDVMSTTLRTTVGNIRLLKELAANDKLIVSTYVLKGAKPKKDDKKPESSSASKSKSK